MFENFINKIKEILRRMVAYKTVEETIEDNIYAVGEEMTSAIEKWRSIYQDDSPWLDDKIISLGLGKAICQTMKMQVLSEMGTEIKDNEFMNEQYQKHFVEKLSEHIEKAMAMGGVVARPYFSNGEIYTDFCLQGDFIPIAFDDDGEMTDVAFVYRFVSGSKYFTRVERQTFNKADKTITIQNKGFVSKSSESVGDEVLLEDVEEWLGIEPVFIIPDADAPLYGYYKVPIANNIDLDSPLGISVFSPAVDLIKKADEQFSRLDWEYEGGQLALDISDDVMPNRTEYGKAQMDELHDRIYRRHPFSDEDAYHIFNPSLRDANLQSGLDKYLMRIEDLVGIARGSLSEVTTEAMTATEIKILKQRTYVTVCAHQKAIDKMINGLVKAMSIIAKVYKIDSSELEVATEWKDSVLTDTDAELAQRLQLLDAGIESKAEIRAWWKGEDIETAQAEIDKINEENASPLLDDIFTNRIPTE